VFDIVLVFVYTYALKQRRFFRDEYRETDAT